MRNTTALRPLERPGRSEEELRRWTERRERWVADLDASSHFHRLFEFVPGLYFFAKDREGHLMCASQGLMERYSMRDESELLGMTDFDLNPSLMAQAYVDDDEQLLSGRKELVERLELWWDAQTMPDWFLVTKLPLCDRSGRIQGVMGVLRRPDEKDRQLPVFQTVASAVQRIRRDFVRPLSIAEVARDCGQSVRQLQRRFQAVFEMTPQEFLIKTRLLAAQRYLEQTELTAAEIAEACGFVDSSSFIQHFRKRIGLTPAIYRKQVRNATMARER